MRKKAAIIGGSMSGLFAANFLQKINWDFTVHEMVPSTLSGRGAGIATYDELAKLVEITTGFSKTLGTKCFDRVVFDNKNIVVSKKHYPQVGCCPPRRTCPATYSPGGAIGYTYGPDCAHRSET